MEMEIRVQGIWDTVALERVGGIQNDNGDQGFMKLKKGDFFDRRELKLGMVL